METLRTPDERFENLSGYPFAPHYVEVPNPDGGAPLRMHYVDAGAEHGEPILCLHGQPTWSYLYRRMIPIFAAAGHRVIAPDFIGFGRSDKPTARGDYTYARHVEWLKALLAALDLRDITLVCQDWGGLIGLRAAAEVPERFARIVAANTSLPDGQVRDAGAQRFAGGAQNVPDDQVADVSKRMRAYYDGLPAFESLQGLAMAMAADTSGWGFLNWVKFCAATPRFSVSELLTFSTRGSITAVEAAGYDAPFPDDAHMAGARQFPSLVPIIPDDPAIPANRAAWRVFEAWEKPFFTAFSDNDAVTAGAHVRFQETVPGAKGRSHVTIEGAGHFLQEQKPAELAGAVLRFITETPL